MTINTLYDRLKEVTDRFDKGVCNEKVVQTITFSVPELFEYVEVLEGLRDLVERLTPNKNFDCQDELPNTGWYTRVASIDEILALSKEEQITLHQKLSLQTTFCKMLTKPGNMFKVWDGVQYELKDIETLSNLIR